MADTPLMSVIFRAYNDWLAEFCRTDPARLKGIAMITEYPLEPRRYDQSEYEPFWAPAAALCHLLIKIEG